MHVCICMYVYTPTQNPDTSGGDGVMCTDSLMGVNASVGGADELR